MSHPYDRPPRSDRRDKQCCRRSSYRPAVDREPGREQQDSAVTRAIVVAVLGIACGVGIILYAIKPDCTHGTLPPECIWPAH